MKGFCLEVSGPYACFTRPEMKVERVSYDVITPSAARAIFDAILWKPAIRWQVSKIEVLAPIRWASIRRNEVGAVASPRKAYIFVEDERQQRAGLLLRDVKYRIHAQFELIAPEKRAKVAHPAPEYLVDAEDATDLRKDETPAKYAAIFERRAKKGQCFNQPYLGCRELSCAFRLVRREEEPTSWPVDIQTRDLGFGAPRDLGWMLYDLDFADCFDPQPMFFRANLENGAVTVPPRDSEEVRK